MRASSTRLSWLIVIKNLWIVFANSALRQSLIAGQYFLLILSHTYFGHIVVSNSPLKQSLTAGQYFLLNVCHTYFGYIVMLMLLLRRTVFDSLKSLSLSASAVRKKTLIPVLCYKFDNEPEALGSRQ